MDLIKIGKYIAGKRKGLGMTQKQLAEKLGMSDKSISKWERGVCLPDVSIYMELCAILGISINEFLAGEDISKENIVEKTDDNLLKITKSNKLQLKSLKSVILILVLIAIAAVASLGSVIFHQENRPKNYISPIAHDSAEMKTAELLSGVDGALMFRYSTDDPFQSLDIFMSEYQNGKQIAKTKVADLSRDSLSPTSGGMIVLVPDFASAEVKLIVTDDYAKYSTAFPILSGAEGRESFGRSAVQIEAETPLQFNAEQGLAALIYAKDLLSALPIEAMEKGDFGANNDYVYYFSIQFGK